MQTPNFFDNDKTDIEYYKDLNRWQDGSVHMPNILVE